MVSISFGAGQECTVSLKVLCLNDSAAGMEMVDVLMPFLYTTATPPPRPSSRGFSMYVYPVGVVSLSEK